MVDDNPNNPGGGDDSQEGQFIMPGADGVTSGIPQAETATASVGAQRRDAVASDQARQALMHSGAARTLRAGVSTWQRSGMSVKAKLIGALSLMLLLVAILGGTAIYTLNSLDTTSQRIASSYVKLAKLAEEVKQQAYIIRETEKDFMLTEDLTALDKAARGVAKLKEQLKVAREMAVEVEEQTGVGFGETYAQLDDITLQYEAGLAAQVKSIQSAATAIADDLAKVESLRGRLFTQVEVNRVRMADLLMEFWIVARANPTSANIRLGNQLDVVDKDLLNVQIQVAKYLIGEDTTYLDAAASISEKIRSQLDEIKRETKNELVLGNIREVRDTLAQYSAVLKEAADSVAQVNAAKAVVDAKVDAQKESLKKLSDGLLTAALTVTNKNWETISSESKVLSSVGQNATYSVLSVAVIGLLLGFFILFTVPMPIVRTLINLVESVDKIATGDLKTTIDVTSGDELGALANSANAMRGNLILLVNRIQEASVVLSSAVKQIQASSAEQSASSTQQASTINELSTSLTEIAQSTNALAGTARTVASRTGELSTLIAKADDASRTTMGAMDEIGSATEDTTTRINGLNDKMEAITEAVATIQTVADQTTLLSMNASIEANKAGEAGTGFTVVATEIRRLADRTISAGSQIGGTVRDIRHATENSVMAMDKTSESIRLGVGKVRQAADDLMAINSAMGSVATDGDEISRGLEGQSQASQNAKQTAIELLNAADTTAMAARQASAAAYDLSTTASQLSAAVAEFSL